MVKHTQTIRRHFLTNCLSVFDHFMGLMIKELTINSDLTFNFIRYIALIFQSVSNVKFTIDKFNFLVQSQQ